MSTIDFCRYNGYTESNKKEEVILLDTHSIDTSVDTAIDASIDTSISALLEMMPMYHRLIFNKLEKKPPHVTKTQFFILLALMGNDTLNMTQLSVYIASSKEQATRAVAPLVEAGFVERFHDDANRKLVLVRLTSAGQAFLQETKEQLHQALEHKFSTLPEPDQQELLRSLHSILRILKQL